MIGLQLLASEFGITISDGGVWLAIGQGLVFSAVCLLFGIWVTRAVGLLEVDAPAGETLGVGLASGLMVLASWWAAIWSGGRSSFTPVAIGFAIAIVFALVRRFRARGQVEPDDSVPAATDGNGWTRNRPIALAALGGGVFIVAVALLYGSTMAPSARDGVQPVEFNDTAYYSVLGQDLAATGTETNASTSGFTDLPGLPTQTWYHWGELWLASAVITIFGTAPIAARHFVVLPVVLLAVAALTGTLVRKISKTTSRRAYLFGAVVCLFLAPVPLVPGPFFSSWAVGLIFGITMYGLAAVAVALGLYCLVVVTGRAPTWGLAGFVGSAAAFILPAHIAIALLALVGVGSVAVVRVARSLLMAHRLPVVSEVWRRTWLATGIALVATVAWGLFTGHGLGGTGGVLPDVPPFNATWGASVALTILGAGALLAVPIAWFVIRKEAPAQADVYLGTMAIIFVGAVVWGARLADFTMFHFFFGGIALFATPVAAIAVWTLWTRSQRTPRVRVAAGVIVLCALQLEFGISTAAVRLQAFGPGEYPAMPASLLMAIRQLPVDAKLAYACELLEEFSFTDQRLLSIDAHTGRRVVPMCFQADRFGPMIGAPSSAQIPNEGFAWAPQRALYQDAAAHPSSAEISAFLKQNGIEYIYADAMHPNSLLPDAVSIFTGGDAQLLRVP